MRNYGNGSVLGATHPSDALMREAAQKMAQAECRDELTGNGDSVLNRLVHKLAWLSEVTNRLETKMDFVDGPRPPQAGNEKVSPAASGALEGLDQALTHFVMRLDEQVRRLERIVG